jgi:hypothetical protein
MNHLVHGRVEKENGFKYMDLFLVQLRGIGLRK